MLKLDVLKVIAAALLSILIVSTVFYSFVEGWSWVDSLSFASSILTTTGHMKLLPSSDLSKFFTVVLSFSGISLFLFLITHAADEFLKREKK